MDKIISLMNPEFIRREVREIKIYPGFRKVLNNVVVIYVPVKDSWLNRLLKRKSKLIVSSNGFDIYTYTENLDEILSGKIELDLGWIKGTVEKDNSGDLIFISSPHIVIYNRSGSYSRVFSNPEELNKFLDIINREFSYIKLVND